MGHTRLGAFIMTRHRPLILKRTLELLLDQTCAPDHVLVVDNGPSSETERVVSSFSSTRVTYQAMNDNLGPAGAAAYALDRLGRQDYDWIYWGDDDDPPASPDTIERLMKVAISAGADTGAVGAVGAMWDWKRGELHRLPDKALTGVVSVDMIAGNSHFILRREIIAHVGVPDARLFFGLEELEYCLRIRTAGYRLLVPGDLMKEHRARAGHLHWTPARPFIPTNSPDTLWRRFYSTRNYIYAMNTTFRRPDLARRESFKVLVKACLSWSRGPRYGASYTALQLRAIVDAYLGHMGRTIVPVPKYDGAGAAS